MGHFKKSERIFLFTLLLYPVIHVTIFYVGVNLNSIFLAFEKYDINLGKYYFDGISNFVKFFQAVKYESVMKTAIKNSCITYLFMQGIFFPLCVVFSFFIYKRLPGSGFFKIVLFLPQIISSIVVTLMFKYFVEVGVPYLVKILTHSEELPMSLLSNVETRYWTLLFYGMWAGFGGSIILYTGAMSRIPDSIIEYGRLDGLSIWQEFWHITLPLIYPTLVTMMVVSVSGFFTSQVSAYNFYGGNAPPNINTLGYYFFVRVVGSASSNADYPYASAMGLIFTAIAAPVTLTVKWLLEKYGPNTEF
ncbi:MAG: sugar ABC transporter permease [Candidatus Borkfalkiaceae bacterium]|nr:sugar ABC transporter permease [Clostridia bacterium]MDY6223870.1 sugar ABC transporter permease [Christensenellaceae bacterium]